MVIGCGKQFFDVVNFWRLSSFAISLLFFANSTIGYASNQSITVNVGYSKKGVPTKVWKEILAERDDFQGPIKDILPSKEDHSWQRLFKKIVPEFKKKLPILNSQYPNTRPPQTVKIIVGNQGAPDASTYGETVIAINSRIWASSYGSPSKKENVGRVLRILSHEYTHLLTKAWRKGNVVLEDSSFRKALWEAYYEGLGTYWSLSENWLETDGKLSPQAQKTLAYLEERFVDRLQQIAAGNDDPALLVGLSEAKFSERWGSLTYALWLAKAIKGKPNEIERWAAMGPNGVIKLASENINDKFKNQVLEINPFQQSNDGSRSKWKEVFYPFHPEVPIVISQYPWGISSHFESGNEYQWDFKVPYGTEVLAVESGKVIEVYEPKNGGGCSSQYSNSAHNVKIEHLDGTVAQYAHITSAVRPGDFLNDGDRVGFTAKNGWICEPHLHFGIYVNETSLYNSPTRQTIPLRFKSGLVTTSVDRQELP